MYAKSTGIFYIKFNQKGYRFHKKDNAGQKISFATPTNMIRNRKKDNN